MKLYIAWPLIVFLLSEVHGQNNRLKVGDKAPKLTVIEWIKGNAVKEFKKGKVYVVEFGATWCKPCIESIPELTTLQKKFKDRVSVISVFVMELDRERGKTKKPAYVKKVEEFVNKRKSQMDYDVAVDNPEQLTANTWLRAAGITGIPCSFVIDKNSRIAWIGNDITTLNRILEFATSREYQLATLIKENQQQKRFQIPWNPNELLLINGNGGNDTDFLYRSILTRAEGELPGGHSQFISSYRYVVTEEGASESAFARLRGRVQVTNASLSELYYMAYGDTLYNQSWGRGPRTGKFIDTIKYSGLKSSYGLYWYKPILQVKDSSKFTSPANKYNYSLKVPLEKGSASFLRDAMQRDLDIYFGYKATVDSRLMPCWKLVASDEAKILLQTKMRGQDFKEEKNDSAYLFYNANIQDIIRLFTIAYGYGIAQPNMAIGAPFIDETDITGQIDFWITHTEFDEMKKGDIDAGMKFLERLKLKMKKGEKKMKVVVIADR
ncbi:MAG: TlpA disulfide reductase family protein [Chitinophagaceae bacterium]